MKTIETKVYQFDELSDKAKEKAIEWGRDLNVSHDWWDFICDDASNIGLKITEFDTYRGTIDGKFLTSGADVAREIIKNHGPNCGTYKTAIQFETDKAKIFANPNDDNNDEKLDELEENFRRSLLEDYILILKNEYEYMTSDEAVIETIRINEYDFTEDGKRF